MQRLRPQFIGNIFLTMGEEKSKSLSKLEAQNIAKSYAGARQILDLVIAGEYPLAIQIFNHHAYVNRHAGNATWASYEHKTPHRHRL
jgi:iron(III) transport system substrate-binding protein